MNLFTFTTIITFISNFAIGLLFLIKTKRKSIGYNLGWTCIASSIWALGAYYMSIAKSQGDALFWIKIAHIGIIFTPTLFCHFILRFANRFKLHLILVIYALAFVFLWQNFFYANFFGLKYVFGKFYFFHSDIRQNPTYFIFYFCFYWLFLLYAFFLLASVYLKSTGVQRNQLKYFLIAMIIAWSGPEGMFLLVFGLPLYPFSNFFNFFYPFIFAYAILRYRLLDINIAVTRAGIFIFVYTLILGLPFLFGFRTGLWIWALLLMGILASASPFIYNYLRYQAENRLLAEQKRYQKLLLQAASGMVRERNLNHLARLIVHIVKRAVKIEFAAIFLDDPGHQIYRLKGIRDSGLGNLEINFTPLEKATDEVCGVYLEPDRGRSSLTGFPYNHPLVDYLKNNQEPVLYEELPLSWRTSLQLPLPISVVVPSLIENNLLGFVFLGEKLNHQPYSQDDLAVFRTLSHQAALAISYCLFLEEFKNSQEKIFTADKLHLIGGMADGAAHQIKNRLNQFAVVAGDLDFNMKDFIEAHPKLIAENPDLKKAFDEFLTNTASIIANVTRTDGIIKGILNFGSLSQDEKAKLVGEFSLNEIISLVSELVQTKHQIAKLPLTLNLGPSDIIYAIKIKLIECLFNILDNAYEAILDKINYRLKDEEKKKFKPEIRLKLIPAVNYNTPDPKFNLTLVDKKLNKELKTAMKICSAFAGFNAASIFRKID